MYEFFFECGKRFNNDPYKQQLLQNLALGNGGLIIEEKNKHFLATNKGFFQIPHKFSEKAMESLCEHLWSNDDFEKMEKSIEESKKNWTSIKKKEKMYLFTQYAASLNECLTEKIRVFHLLMVALLIKLVKPRDVAIDNSVFKLINCELLKTETYYKLNYSFDLTATPKSRSCETTLATVDD